MADIKISELTQVSALNNGDLVEVSQVNALAPSGYTSLKASMTDLGKKVNSDIEYTTDLADFTDKTTLGAIKETAKGKNVADEYDATQTYDKGDVVIYKNTLYICTTNNTTGTWDPSKWTATTIDNIIGDLSTLTTTDKSSLVGAVNELDKTATIPFTGASGLSTNNCQIFKRGIFLVVCIEIVLTSDQSGWYDILTTDTDITLPSGVSLFGVVSTDSESIMPKYCQAYQSGTKMKVRIRNGKASGQYRGQILVPLG